MDRTSIKNLNIPIEFSPHDEESTQVQVRKFTTQGDKGYVFKMKSSYIAQRQLEDTYMKRLMFFLFRYNQISNPRIQTITQKRTELDKLYVKFVDSIAALLVLINIALAYIENQEFQIKNQNISSTDTNTYRALIMIISFVLVILIIISYRLRIQIEKMQMRRLHTEGLISSKMVYPMCLEMLICGTCCNPNNDFTFSGRIFYGQYTYSYDSIIFVIQLMKSYLFLRVWLHYSMWTSEKASYTCSKYRVKPNLQFALKAELKYRPILFLTQILIFTILILGLAVMIFERSYVFQFDKKDFKLYQISDLLNAWWLMIITMTTVGFGDYYPWTHLGRFVCLIACIIGQLLLSLLVISLSNSAEFNQEESKAYHILIKIKVTTKTKEMACNVIKNFVRLNHLIKQKNSKSFAERFLINLRLKKGIELYETEYRTSQIDNLPMDEMLKKLNEKMGADIQNINKEVEKLHEFQTRLDRFKVQQESTDKNMDQILKMQANISQTLRQKKYKK